KKRQEHAQVCVVVSAMGKTTDSLIAQAKEIAKQPARRELDMLLSIGERASAALLTMALVDMGVDAISFTGSQSGIITNATHAGARILEVRPYRVQDELAAGRVVVIAGFQGVSYAKEITTLGRGGSDTTAVALAAALDATCEIYSDVDGVWTSDPRVVPDTQKIEALSYEEMQELAEAGAKVLNAQAVQFAKAKGIAIYALRTPGLQPDSSSPLTGTVVRKDAPPAMGGVRGVAHRATLHRLVGDRMKSLAEMLRFLDEHHLPSGQIVALGPSVEIERRRGDARVDVLVPPEDAHGFEDACAALPAGASWSRADDVGAVSLVGHGILEDRRVLSESLALLDELELPIDGVTTSSFRITFLLPPGLRVADAARALHKRFVADAGAVGDAAASTPS
ncbi:MAG TPA: aspartate kinase, partial [Myxococcota bacterium]